jgi:hypothetical protein
VWGGGVTARLPSPLPSYSQHTSTPIPQHPHQHTHTDYPHPHPSIHTTPSPSTYQLIQQHILKFVHDVDFKLPELAHGRGGPCAGPTVGAAHHKHWCGRQVVCV